MEGGERKRFGGKIRRKEDSYIFIRTKEFPSDIFAHVNETSADSWRNLAYDDQISFELGFNFRGPSAINLKREI